MKKLLHFLYCSISRYILLRSESSEEHSRCAGLGGACDLRIVKNVFSFVEYLGSLLVRCGPAQRARGIDWGNYIGLQENFNKKKYFHPHISSDVAQRSKDTLYREMIIILGLLMCAPCLANLQDYELQVAQDPSDHRALYNVGVAAFKENDLTKAQAAFDCLKPLCKDEAWDAYRHEQLFYNAGNTEAKLQKYAEAVESFEEVLKVNLGNELAQKKLEYAKKMLEQQQEQQQQDKQDNQDEQDQQDQNKNDQGQDDKQDNSQSNDKDKNSQDKDDEQSQDQDGQDKDKENNNDNESGDQQQDDKQNDQQNQQDGGDSQDGEQNQDANDQQQQQDKQDKNNNEQGDKQEQQSQESDQQEPELNKEEQQLLAALQGYDQKMNKEMGQRMLRAAKGAHDKNNW